MTQAHNERRPALAGADLRSPRAASKQNKSRQQGKAVGASSVIPPRLDWSAALIDAATGFVPEYGSPEFEALPDNSPEKVASCVRAAEAWRIYFAPEEIGRRLRAELEAAHLADDEAVWSADIVQQVHRSANRPSYAELSERRGEPANVARGRAQQRRLGLVPVG